MWSTEWNRISISPQCSAELHSFTSAPHADPLLCTSATGGNRTRMWLSRGMIWVNHKYENGRMEQDNYKFMHVRLCSWSFFKFFSLRPRLCRHQCIAFEIFESSGGGKSSGSGGGGGQKMKSIHSIFCSTKPPSVSIIELNSTLWISSPAALRILATHDITVFSIRHLLQKPILCPSKCPCCANVCPSRRRPCCLYVCMDMNIHAILIEDTLEFGYPTFGQ